MGGLHVRPQVDHDGIDEGVRPTGGTPRKPTPLNRLRDVTVARSSGNPVLAKDNMLEREPRSPRGERTPQRLGGVLKFYYRDAV